MAAELTYVRIQEYGRIILPVDIRKRLGLEIGDRVAIQETPEGMLITSSAIAAINAPTEIGDALKEQGFTLEDMIESGRAIREELYRERYGHLDTGNS